MRVQAGLGSTVCAAVSVHGRMLVLLGLGVVMVTPMLLLHPHVKLVRSRSYVADRAVGLLGGIQAATAWTSPSPRGRPLGHAAHSHAPP